MGTPHVHEWKRTPEGDYCDGCDTFWRDWNTERLEAENGTLRELLWANHEHSATSLYGDDGKLYCHRCRLDFRTAPIGEIHAAFMRSVFVPERDSPPNTQDGTS